MLVFANISRTEHASAVKFHMDYEKNMSNILVPKSQKVWKKVEKIGLSSNCNRNDFTCMQFGIVPETIFQKFTKINGVEQCLICINSKWPPFVPNSVSISSTKTPRNFILVSTPMFSWSKNMLVITISSLDPFIIPNLHKFKMAAIHTYLSLYLIN